MRVEEGRVISVLTIGALFAAALLVAAMPTAEAQSGGVTVEARGNAFIPSSITVLVGTTVTWVQRDSAEHTVTADDNQPESWDQGILLPMNPAGILNDFEHTFEALGTTTYHCEVHANMVGEVIVVESFDSPFVTVNANDGNEFSPERVDLNASQGVVWINSGTIPHTVTFEDASIGDLGEIAAGEEVRFNFTAPGSFRYRCTYHSGSDFETGMVGKVVVGGNASFPTVLVIESPTENETINGTFTAQARLVRGDGQPNVTSLEYRVDEGNWTAINATSDLDEFQFAFDLDTTALEDGNHTLDVRALADQAEQSTASVGFLVDNGQGDDGRDDEGGGIPNVAAPLVLLIFGVAAFSRRRRSQ